MIIALLNKLMICIHVLLVFYVYKYKVLIRMTPAFIILPLQVVFATYLLGCRD